MRVELVNLTRWSSQDLKRLFKAGCRYVGAKPSKVTVKQTRRKSTYGWAFEDKSVLLHLPKDFCGNHGCLTELAQTFEHELYHVKDWTLDHDDMPEKGEQWKYPVTWADGHKVRPSRASSPQP